MQDIKFYCPHCTQPLEGPEDMLGQLIDCPSCGKPVAVRPPSPPIENAPSKTAHNSTAEATEYECHAAMFRNRPVFFTLVAFFPLVVMMAMAFAGEIALGIAYAIFFWLFISGPILLVWKIATLCSKLTITNKRSTYRRGILSKRTTEVRHQDIRNLQIDQRLMQRIFGTGTVGISSAGQSGIEIEASGMPNPNQIKSILDKYRMV